MSETSTQSIKTCFESRFRKMFEKLVVDIVGATCSIIRKPRRIIRNSISEIRVSKFNILINQWEERLQIDVLSEQLNAV